MAGLDPATMSALVAQWGYLIVFIAALAEAIPLIGFLVPGQGLVIFSGALAATGRLDVWVLMGLVALAGVIGDAGTYYLGRHYGRGFVERFGPRIGMREHHLARSDALFAKYGAFALVLARFSFLTRAAGPLLAGISRMPQRVFWPINVLGGVAMGVAYIGLGFGVGLSFLVLQRSLGRILAVTLIVAVGVYVYYRILRKLAPQFTREDLGLALLGGGSIVGMGFVAQRVKNRGADNVFDAAGPGLERLLEPAGPALTLLDSLFAPVIVGLAAIAGLLLLAFRHRAAEGILVGLGVGGALVLASTLSLWLPEGLPDPRTAIAATGLGVASYLAAAQGRWTGASVATVGGFATTAAILARIWGGATPAAAACGFLLAVGWLAICLLVLEYRIKSGAGSPPT